MSGWNELVCTTLALYPHFSSFCTMPVYTHTTTDTPQDTHILIPFEDSGPTGPKVDRGWGILFFKDTLMVEQRLWKQWHMLDCLKRSIRQNMPSSSDSMSLQQKVKNGIKSPKWQVSMFDIHLQKLMWMLLPWTHQSQGKGLCIYNYMYRLASIHHKLLASQKIIIKVFIAQNFVYRLF